MNSNKEPKKENRIHTTTGNGEPVLFKNSLRPRYHFTTEKSWINDPNGLVFYKGEYHLFYQCNPKDNTCGLMHWGHAVSTDLIHWIPLPIALYPDDIGTIFSGSAVVDWNNTSGFQMGPEKPIVAVFTHNKPDGQVQSIAYSCDCGRTFTKYEGNPVLERPECKDFRDPKVFWHRETGRWVMVLVAGEKVLIYTATDLIHWKFVSEFGQNDGAHGTVWECPDLFELPVNGCPGECRWVLTVSIASRVQYFIGSFDGSHFNNENTSKTMLWVDKGKDFYASATWNNLPEADGRRIMIGWLNNWEYARETPTKPWRGMLTIPRELRLEKTVHSILLTQQPIEELHALRGELIYHAEAGSAFVGKNILQDVSGCSLELETELESESDGGLFGIRLRKEQDGYITIEYDNTEQCITIDRMHTDLSGFSTEFPCRHSAKLNQLEGSVQMHIFIDCCSIEVFCNDGEMVITDQIFPSTEYAGIELYGNGHFRIRKLEIWKLNSIWNSHNAQC